MERAARVRSASLRHTIYVMGMQCNLHVLKQKTNVYPDKITLVPSWLASLAGE
jgi:hypothetical protein